MKLEEFLRKLRVAIDEQNKAYAEWHDFLMVELPGATLTPEMLERSKHLRARAEEARKGVRKVEELLSEVED